MPVYVADWEAYADSVEPAGLAEAPLAIVTFGDFECPACRSLANSLTALRAENPQLVRVHYRHFPLRSHRFAVAAAYASECAREQDRFEAMHDRLFERSDTLGLAPWTWFAVASGVPDTALFSECMRSERASRAVSRDLAAAVRLGVARTPTVLINGHRFDGAPQLESLRRLVTKYMEEARSGRGYPLRPFP